jgi:hypothetical protein
MMNDMVYGSVNIIKTLMGDIFFHGGIFFEPNPASHPDRVSTLSLTLFLDYSSGPTGSRKTSFLCYASPMVKTAV